VKAAYLGTPEARFGRISSRRREALGRWSKRRAFFSCEVKGDAEPKGWKRISIFDIRSEMETPADSLQIVCLLDVLGFANRLQALGLECLQAKYTELIDYVKQQKGGLDVVPGPDGHIAV